ncbi:MAG: LptA/OstA family protein [bacterium]|jgi:lipopolysaccharide transport protein LptA|tara:strand:- start:2990 stop:4243 length:1254 start_codon:yes stop_codon:yes gene_type:complete
MLKRKIKYIFSVFLLFFSIATTEPAWNYRQASLAAPASGFEITRNTLDHLQREGFSKALTEMLSPILNTHYLNLKDFLEALPIRLTKKESDLLMRYASTQQIKIQADEFSSDLNENAAVFRGNVKGVIPRENIELTTAKLRLVSGKGKNFEKLIGEGGVSVKQWDREVRSDFAIYTQIDLEDQTLDTDSSETKSIETPQQTLKLQGNVIMKASQGSVISNTVFVNILLQHATLEGKDASKEGRIKVEANLSELETNRNEQSSNIKTQEEETENQENTEQKKVLLLASRGVLDNIKHLAMFEGDVEMERTPDNLYIHAGKITLRLNELQELQSIRAEQGVCFEQPGRVAKADKANFDEIKKTILLEGSAEVQSGKYHLQGNTINLYLDVNKGIAQGDNKAPIQMTILGEQAPAIFACR